MKYLEKTFSSGANSKAYRENWGRVFGLDTLTLSQQYLELREKIRLVRARYNGCENQEEDALLEKMDDIWYQMSEVEIQEIERHLEKKD